MNASDSAVTVRNGVKELDFCGCLLVVMAIVSVVIRAVITGMTMVLTSGIIAEGVGGGGGGGGMLRK